MMMSWPFIDSLPPSISLASGSFVICQEVRSPFGDLR